MTAHIQLIEELERLHNTKWNTLHICYTAASDTKKKLASDLQTEVKRLNSEDTSLVTYGSLARDEWTKGSDLDWTFLIDGQANSDHLTISKEISKALEKHDYAKPGPTGTFGNLTFSHDLIHQIGGQNDTNRNMTQRVLLILESIVVPDLNGSAYERVIKGVINRYLEQEPDKHLLHSNQKRYRVPRFLLNDIVRFWRTMAVDFASKQRDRAGKGWGLRNAKLRMSRKLIFASGLLTCFSCNLNPELQSSITTDSPDVRFNLANHLRDFVTKTPLEILADAVISYRASSNCAINLFSSYNEFLAILADDNKRSELKDMTAEQSAKSELFKTIQAVSSSFQKGLDELFNENEMVRPLTAKYGVF